MMDVHSFSSVFSPVIVAGKCAKFELKDQSQTFVRLAEARRKDEFASKSSVLHTRFSMPVHF